MKRAFSLIELSIVILIIGILVAGVTQSSRLITQMRLASARSFTQSSPVNSIKDVVLWLDSTNEASFANSESEDGVVINNWYDINPKSVNKKIIPAGASKPTYKSNGINNLPAVDFNGSNQYFQAAHDADLNPSTFTLFITFIVDSIPASSYDAIISSRNSSGGLTGFTLYARNFSGNVFEFMHGNGSGSWSGAEYSYGSFPYGTTKIVTLSHDGSNGKIYADGILGATTPGAFVRNNGSNFRIGVGTNETSPTYFLDGKIGEIILFEGALKNEERNAIEKYLGKKWGVDIR